MSPLHVQEKEQLKKLFKQASIDRFEERYTVYEVFLQTERHVTIEELCRLLEDAGHSIDRQLVADTLQLMCHFGFARRIRFDNGDIRYEHLHLGQHHDHMICTRCQRIIEFEDKALESLQVKIAESHGFHVLQHRMELYGLCRECRQKRDLIIPLTAAKQGEEVIIKDLTGGRQARMRLLAMGLRVGDTIEVLTNTHRGQLVVAADFNRYVLGRNLAEKIRVAPVR